jgi:mannose-6-phosphate isomerase-like protein (cupin superfamily)
MCSTMNKNMELPRPYLEKRPWGEFIEFSKNTLSTVKIITVEANQAFSLQTHSKRDEFWHIISGSGILTIGKSTSKASAGQDYFVPRNTNHRAEAQSEKLVLLEISFGEFDEDDIKRLDDRYGRIKS